MDLSNVSIIVVPRDRFSPWQRSLESLFASIPAVGEIICVDAGSPRPVRDYLEGLGAAGKVRLIRVDRILGQNQARNLGHRAATGTRIVFVDNDVLYAPGWLQSLVTSQNETGAGIVGPVIYEREPIHTYVHDAGKYLSLEGPPGRHTLKVIHVDPSLRTPTLPADPRLRHRERYACDAVEFHCMLVRREVLDTCGPCDEALLSVREHLDFCLSARRAGFTVYVEPSAVVTFLLPPPVRPMDRTFFFLRWSDRWTHATARHFDRKWGVRDPDYASHELAWVRDYRHDGGWPDLTRALDRVAGWRLSRALLNLAEGAYATVGRRRYQAPVGKP